MIARGETWYRELVGKTQELSLSVAGKERSLRKLLDEFPDSRIYECEVDDEETTFDSASYLLAISEWFQRLKKEVLSAGSSREESAGSQQK